MTVFVVPVEPVGEGVLDGLVSTTPIEADEAPRLYRAMAADTVVAAAASGGDVLLNHPPSDRAAAESADAESRSILELAGVSADTVRFEVQVGSSYDARVGNAITHLLREEDADSVALLDPLTPSVTRRHLDAAAMQLRRHETVLGPALEGAIYLAGFTDPIGFDRAFEPPALASAARAAATADHSVGFLEALPVARTPAAVRTLIASIQARSLAGRPVASHTADVLAEMGLELRSAGDGVALRRVAPDRS